MNKSYKTVSAILFIIAIYCFARAFGLIDAMNSWSISGLFDILLHSVGL